MALYFHLPFCRRKCPYCDFVSFSNFKPAIIGRYFTCLNKELVLRAGEAELKEIRSIYFGGGTPSLAGPSFIGDIIKLARDYFNVANDAEITIEANPDSLDAKKIEMLTRCGVNRFSVGVQSFIDEELKTLGRLHDADKAVSAVRTLAESDVANFNIDLIFGIPGQTIDSWKYSLDDTLTLNPAHISVYPLTISENCGWDMQVNGEPSGEDLTADMYELASGFFQKNGFSHYEISNFAKPGFECIHNINYWTYGDYLGLGAGAHSKIGNKRFFNIGGYRQYIELIKKGAPATKDFEILDDETTLSEKVILNLRLSHGINVKKFNEQNKIDVLKKFKGPVSELKRHGLIKIDNSRIFIPRKYRFIANEVFVSLLPN